MNQRKCKTCGELVDPGEPPHETVERIVRPHQIYKGQRAGGRVSVEVRFLSHASVVKGTLSLDEWDRLRAPKAPAADAGQRVEEVRQNTRRAREDWLRQKAQREHGKTRAAEVAAAEAGRELAPEGPAAVADPDTQTG